MKGGRLSRRPRGGVQLRWFWKDCASHQYSCPSGVATGASSRRTRATADSSYYNTAQVHITAEPGRCRILAPPPPPPPPLLHPPPAPRPPPPRAPHRPP